MKTLAGMTALTGVMAAVAMACNSTDGRPSRSPAPDSTPESGPTTSTGPSVDVPDHSTTVAPPNGTTRIRVTIGEERFEMTLDGSAASQDLIAQLPVTLQMRDHGGVEKTGRLPKPLSLDGQPPGADPDVADVGYYAPSTDLVFYYGDQSYYAGIVVLGRMNQRTATRISQMEGSITATVTVAQ
ncbi:MAG: cyclophilin-like fold protein [Nocardioidaceae bacterium]|jgi:hypothetical protein